MLSTATHVFSDLYYHVNWHCFRDDPMITPELEAALHPFLRDYCNSLDGALCIEVGGTDTHVHILLKAEPHLQTSDLIGKMKGASAHAMNRSFGMGALKWQRGYGIVTFAAKNLPALVHYVRNQKEHHGKSTSNPTLELCGIDSSGSEDPEI